MDLRQCLLQAFRQIAGHMTNINTMQGVIEEIVEESSSLEEIVDSLTARLKTVDVTLQTDIHILINEVKHLEGSLDE